VRGNLLAQYLRIKAQNEHAILLFRLGDFYEMFFDDAKTAATLLDLTLTARNRGEPDEVPLCGFPAHASQPYVTRLLAAGHAVAVCEQRAAPGRSIMDREVVRVITPGTILEEEGLDPAVPSLLGAVVACDGAPGFGLAVVDFATGALRATEAPDWAVMREELERLAPRELLLDHALPEVVRDECGRQRRWSVVEMPAGAADVPPDLSPLAGRAVAGVLAYVDRTYRRRPDHLRAPDVYTLAGFVGVDAATRRNLELLETLRGERHGSLLGLLDQTRTPMGVRRLREWILYPLRSPRLVGDRLDGVAHLVERPDVRAELSDALGGLGDLARLAGRVGARTAGPRDLASVAAALERTQRARDALSGRVPSLLAAAREALDGLPTLVARIRATLVETPPPHTRIPGFIRDGADPEVDALRGAAADGKGWLARFEASERTRTGIATLKVRHNKVFGYYLEITKANLALVPPDYERKQTLVNAERFVTPALKEQEARVLGAEDRQRTLEQHCFEVLLEEAAAHQASLARTAAAVSTVDVAAALAHVAHERSWVRPRLTDARRTLIRAGRHPVVEALSTEPFVPNDVNLDAEQTQVLLITGPNMGGKSTYLRQVALITLLAHMGSFVPASDAEIGLTDRIFTRVGASDNLVGGESTFMVEMRETAFILANLGERSLVILDEIGRGTSTFDGISIAWAVAEHLHDAPARPRTLFATHYHELTALAAEKERVSNLSVAVAEWKGEIVFLRQIVDGAAPRSYGVEVARLAGVPPAVVARARTLLGELEAGEGPAHGRPAETAQLPLFAPRPDRLAERLAALDVERITPLEALSTLARLVEEARRAR
jgi:DNA mismatch repair protein MutS